MTKCVSNREVYVLQEIFVFEWRKMYKPLFSHVNSSILNNVHLLIYTYYANDKIEEKV